MAVTALDTLVTAALVAAVFLAGAVCGVPFALLLWEDEE